MNKELSKEIIALIMNQTKELNDALFKIEQECEKEGLMIYRQGFGKVMGYQLTEILNPIFKEHPDLFPEPLREH